MAIKSKIVNVKDFGAKGDFVKPQSNTLGTGTDDSAAFKAAMKYITDNSKRHTQWNDRSADYVLYIPAGNYYITQPASLLSATYTSPAVGGVKILGDGRGLTEITYNPSTGAALMENNNGFNFCTIEGITFTSVGELDGSTGLKNTFFHTFSNNQAQNFIFDKCDWGGGWKYLWHFVGINTNSECSWYHCGVYNSVETAFYIPPHVSGADTTSGSDQMVNYNFYSCQFEIWKGNYFRCDQGGAINIWGGSLINTSGVGTGDGTSNNTFFKLGLAVGDQVFQGARRLLVQGVRFEMRGSTNSKFIECNWKSGNVTFIGCTMDMNSWDNQNIVNSIYDFGSENGAIVSYKACSFMGKHQYKYNSSRWQMISSISYENCEWWSNALPEENIVLTNTSGATNPASSPIARLVNCTSRGKGTNTFRYISDGQVGWHNANRGQVQEKIIRISTPDGFMPRSAEDVYLPLNSLILSCHAIFAAGAVSSTAAGWHFYVKNGDGTTLADHIPNGNNPSTGMNSLIQVNPPSFADTDSKRHLTLSSNSDQNAKGYWIIRYIG